MNRPEDMILYEDEISKYGKCMLEIKRRLNVIAANLEQGTTPQKIMFDTEFVCLQFRIIIELIALGSLAANKKLYKKGMRKIKKQFHPAEIIEFLATVNEAFYPKPVSLNKDSQEEYDINMIPLEEGFLTKEEFINVYNLCSNYLHGRNPFKEDRDYEVRLSFPKWLSEVVKLISVHTITLIESKVSLLTILYFDKNAPQKEMDIMYLRTETITVHK